MPSHMPAPAEWDKTSEWRRTVPRRLRRSGPAGRRPQSQPSAARAAALDREEPSLVPGRREEPLAALAGDVVDGRARVGGRASSDRLAAIPGAAGSGVEEG